MNRDGLYIFHHIYGYGYRHGYWEIVILYAYITLVLHI